MGAFLIGWGIFGGGCEVTVEVHLLFVRQSSQPLSKTDKKHIEHHSNQPVITQAPTERHMGRSLQNGYIKSAPTKNRQ